MGALRPTKICAIVDYGLGNVRAVARMLEVAGAVPRLVSRPEDLCRGEPVILPGVGAFDAGMRELQSRGFAPALRELVSEGCSPLLGICLGMQLLFETSEEGVLPGLGLLPGAVERFVSVPGLRVPHMGWNTVRVVRPDPLLKDLDQGARFYFVHSYHATTTDPNLVLSLTEYGGAFPSVVRRGPVMGAQFHPEKSHRFGKQFLTNFLAEAALC